MSQPPDEHQNPPAGPPPAAAPGSYPPPGAAPYPSMGDQSAPQQPGGYPPPPGGYPPPPGTFPPPGVGQPPAGPWPAGMGPAGPPPKKKFGVGKIVLIVLAVLLVLCAGGATAVWFAVKDEVTETVDASRTRLVAPDTLAGRPKITDPQLQQAADDMVREIQSTVQNETSAVGAFYGDPAQEDLVMIVGASGLMSDPQQELDEAIKGLSTQLALTNMTSVDPGPLGGEASCGDGQSEDLPLGICVWADRGSVGTVVMFFSSRADAEAEFVTMRGQIQQRE
ncbi:hypothetical protein SAMN05443287_101401 [Micromonospora phaseoli]|uniref:Flagellar basal body-associated protein FliL n=1 Tax=Micromonospora phaseoli TaxID=1144548 RepID=A0A1H6S6W2_9ACTN|nr:hypothetical protein [Micromonospora phaseoli]PZW03656.1 hypothetical protein CLV64_101401 [Micromonospora phaseoli]GIJ80838.1 hypothetical protein Xph01_52700 [Micromonospora phaseoli]SEI59152.1 hypothetical protein SAMN05443287_101401 [Micromonospora phaseoli]